MNYLHTEVEAGNDDIIEVTLDGQANVMLLDSGNFNHYRKGESFRYRGGLAKVSPAQIAPPSLGRWHVVVDLGGHRGKVRAAVRVIKAVSL